MKTELWCIQTVVKVHLHTASSLQGLGGEVYGREAEVQIFCCVCIFEDL